MSTSSSLDIEVHVASTEADLIDACTVRATAYGHHFEGDTAAKFGGVEALDRATGTVVLVCRDKATGQAIGTARIQVNKPGGRLLIERDLILPRRIASGARAEVTRLAVLPGADALVKLCLMKSVYLYCMAHGIASLVISARNEALARNYKRLGFSHFLAPGEMLPLAHVGNLPHYILTMVLDDVRASWQRDGHRLYAFMFETTHPDLPDFRTEPRHPSAPRRLLLAA